MKTTLACVLALGLGLAGAASAQQAPAGGPSAKGNAPVKATHTINDGAAKSGHNSFTEGQARQHILNSGYSGVTGLSMGSDGVWRGAAMRNGAKVNVAMDFKGNVTQATGHMGAGHMGAGHMANGGMGDGAMAHHAMRPAPMATGAAGMAARGDMSGHMGGMHHGHHHMMRHHHRWHHRHHHHHMNGGRGVGMSGVDRNDNGVSDKEDRARQH